MTQPVGEDSPFATHDWNVRQLRMFIRGYTTPEPRCRRCQMSYTEVIQTGTNCPQAS
jgi:hypothetical protein